MPKIQASIQNQLPESTTISNGNIRIKRKVNNSFTIEISFFVSIDSYVVVHANIHIKSIKWNTYFPFK